MIWSRELGLGWYFTLRMMLMLAIVLYIFARAMSWMWTALQD